MKKLLILPLLLAIMLFCGRSAAALDKTKPLTQFIHDVWRSKDGLPQNSVKAILQTRDGYLWIGTEEGLARFDGVRFKVFDKEKFDVIKSDDINSLHEDRDGNLWAGTVGGGLLKIRGENVTPVVSSFSATSNIVVAFAEDKEGALWLGTDGGLGRLANGQMTFLTTDDGLSQNNIKCLCYGRDGSLWIGTANGGLNRWRDGHFETFRVQDGLASDSVKAIYQDRDGTLWVGTAAGLNRLREGQWTTYTTREGLSSNNVLSILGDRDGNLWIGTYGGGLNRLYGETFTIFTTKEGLSSDFVESLYEDREGSLWIGTYTAGINRLRENQFTGYSVKEGLSHNIAVSIYQDSSGDMWIGTARGVNRLRPGQIDVYTKEQGLSDNTVRSTLKDRAGNIWFGTNNGLIKWRDQRFTVYTVRDGLASNMINCLFEDSRGRFWVGTRGGGLNLFEAGSLRTFTVRDGLGGDLILSILEDRAGAIWFGTSGGLSRYQDGRFTTYTAKEGLPVNMVMSLHLDAQDALWLGTYGGGLVRFKNGLFSVYNHKKGLFNDIVYHILEDDYGNLWMSCSKGVFRVSKSDIEAFDAGRLPALKSISYGKASGMRTSECVGSSFPAGCKSRDGHLWFPTLDGVVEIDPARLRINAQPPPVLIEQMVVDNVALPVEGAIELAPGRERFEFHYTALSFLAPEQVLFKYKLEGFDHDWIDAGTRRVAYYTNIAPGSYRFLVKACNNDGVWNEAGAGLAFYLAPRFYQTRLFYLLCVLAVTSAAGSIYWVRVRKLQARARKMAQLVEERTRILIERTRQLKEANEVIELVFGTVINDRYRIESLMGQGGMGKIFRVTHLQLNKTFALKLMNSYSAQHDSHTIIRFRREAEALAKINHPNIVMVTDFGVTNNQIPYIVMEYIEGVTLRELINRHTRLSQKEALKIARQICAGLHAAHLQGIVHRDLKPENIMIQQLGDNEPTVRVLDFGIAKLLEKESNEELTGDEETLGTLRYLTPEQFLGLPVDTRSDIFGICLIIYEMLTGVVPPALMSLTQPLTELRPELSPQLDRVIMKGLSQTPANRQQSALDLKHELEAIEAGIDHPAPAMEI